MTNIENMIYKFIDDFYTKDEKLYIKSNCDIGFSIDCFKKDFVSDDWKSIENKYKNLLNYTDLSEFHLEVADRASYFIKKIFEKYVNDNVFVIYSSFEHPNVLKELENVKNKHYLFYNEILKFDFNNVLLQFKKSKCSKMFVYVPGTSVCTGQIIPQRFYVDIKENCKNLGIECMLMCDDVHGMFITPRDYTIFDFVLYTCHSYIPGFDMGMLWSKKSETLGFTNTVRSNEYYKRLCMFLDRLDKVRVFPILLSEYFAEELSDFDHFDLYTNTTAHIFALKTKGLVFNQAYFDKCDEYKVRLGETKAFINFIRLRIQEFILEDPQFILSGLSITKKAIESFLNKLNIYQTDIIFDGKKNIEHKIEENILFK